MPRPKKAVLPHFTLNPAKIIAACLLILVLTLGIYGQTFNHSFVEFDDPIYVTENHMVRSGITWGGTVWAFKTFHSAEWIPLTWLSYMLDYELYGQNSGAFHLSNAGIHLASVLLLFLILASMTGALYRSAAVAVLFAAHPLRVESVAWIAERKDVLSMLFLMLTLKAYEIYARQLQKKYYGIILIFLAFGLMSKPVLITLPFALLLLDYWPLGRLQTRNDFLPLLREKIPMMGLAVISGILNFAAVSVAGELIAVEFLSLGVRIQNAVVAYGRYLEKTFWPANLTYFYSYQSFSLIKVTGYFIVLSALSWFAVKIRKKYPMILVGWLWFLGMLFPMIGIVQAGIQSMADRYTYVPHIGLLAAFVWGAAVILERLKVPAILRAGGFAVIAAALAFLSWKQTAYWKNFFLLSTHAISVTNNNYIAHENLAYELVKQKRYEEARAHYRKAVEIEPHRVRSLYNLGLISLGQGDYSNAREYFLQALAKQPNHIEVLTGLGLAASKSNQLSQATEYFLKALSLNSAYVPARKGAAYSYLQLNMPQQAQYYIDPLRDELGERDPEILILQGLLAGLKQDHEGAVKIYLRILEKNPGNAEALFALGNSYLSLGDYFNAILHYEKLLQIEPHHPSAREKLKIAMSRLQNTDKIQEAS